MLLLNGVFCWFKRLPEFWQTAIVAGAIFLAGFAANEIFGKFQDVPSQLGDVMRTQDSILQEHEGINAALGQQQDLNTEFKKTLQNISESVDTIKNEIKKSQWRIEVLACYQDNEDPVLTRECLEDVRNQ